MLPADPAITPRLRRPVRDDAAASSTRSRRSRALVAAPWPPAADRRDERLRRAAARRARGRRSMRVAASSNKCIEGVPGLGFVICRKRGARRDARATPRRWCSTCTTSGRTSRRPGSTASRRRSTSSSPSTRRWRNSAAEGGAAGRGGRYAENCRILDRRHARARLRDAAAATPCRRRSSSPSTCRRDPELRLPGLLRPAEGARLRDLSGQAHRGRQLPHRLHRPARRRATCAARSRRCARCSPRWASASLQRRAEGQP